jgi:aminoglycoside 2''-phosphotransferase
MRLTRQTADCSGDVENNYFARLIQSHCPSLALDSLLPAGEGDFCEAYLVNRTWIFRFAKHAEARESLRREACLLPTLAFHLDLRIPSPQFVCVDHGPGFVGHPILPGHALTRARYLSLAEEQRNRCALQVAGFLIQMQSLDLSAARACGVPAIDYRATYAALLDRMRKDLFGLLDPADRGHVERTVQEYLQSDDPSSFQPCLLHGDLSPDHLLYDDQAAAITGVIDFGDMAIGDPAWDLVFIYEDYGLDFLVRLLNSYPSEDREALLRRVYRLWELDLMEYASRWRAGKSIAELGPVLDQLTALRTHGEERRRALLAICL